MSIICSHTCTMIIKHITTWFPIFISSTDFTNYNKTFYILHLLHFLHTCARKMQGGGFSSRGLSLVVCSHFSLIPLSACAARGGSDGAGCGKSLLLVTGLQCTGWASRCHPLSSCQGKWGREAFPLDLKPRGSLFCFYLPTHMEVWFFSFSALEWLWDCWQGCNATLHFEA